MSNISPLEIAQAFVNAVAKKEYDQALSYVDQQCEYHNMMMEKAIGPEAICATLQPFFDPTEKNEIRYLTTIADGPMVLTERLDRHLIDGKWAELPVAGIFEIHAGKITKWREYFDLATLQNQLA